MLAIKVAQWGLLVPKNLSLKILCEFRCILALTSYFVQATELKTNIVWIFFNCSFISSERSGYDHSSETKLCTILMNFVAKSAWCKCLKKRVMYQLILETLQIL